MTSISLIEGSKNWKLAARNVSGEVVSGEVHRWYTRVEHCAFCCVGRRLVIMREFFQFRNASLTPSLTIVSRFVNSFKIIKMLTKKRNVSRGTFLGFAR